MAASISLQVPLAGTRHLPALDELKGLAILLVVLNHAGGTLVWQNLLHGDLGVDMFLILSGLGLALSGSSASPREFMFRRLRRVMPAYWVVLTIFWALNTNVLQLSYEPADILLHYLGLHAWFGDQYAFSFNSSFWFISLILVLYGLSAWLRPWLLPPDRLILIGGTLSTVVALACFFSNQPGMLGHLGLRVPGFFLGLLAGTIMRTGRLELNLSVGLGLGLFVVSYVPYTIGIVFHPGVVAGLLMTAYVFALRTRLPAGARGRLGSILGFFGRYSFEIYLLHQPFIREYSYYVLGRFFDLPSPQSHHLILAMVGGFVLSLVLSIELQRLLARLPSRSQSSGTA